MMEITYKCDRCEQNLDKGAASSNRNFAVVTETRYKLRFFKAWRNVDPLFIEHELCEKCRESLERWLNNENT